MAGNRVERKKWKNAFDGVDLIIFMVNLLDYDRVLREDNATNRMQDSELLFNRVLNTRSFHSSSIVLLFTHMDLFKQKLHRSPLKTYYPDYTGGHNVREAVDFLKHLFVKLNRGTVHLDVYTVDATDREDMHEVIECIRRCL